MSTSKSSAGDRTGSNSGGRFGPSLRRDEPLLSLRESDEAFDALTDLFLGEVGRSGSGHVPERPEADRAAKAPGQDAGEYRPVLRLAPVEIETDDDWDEAQASFPDRQESDRPERGAPVVLVDDEPSEAIARPGSVAPPVRVPVIESLLLGNLPVLASAWAGQYVREIAAAAGKPVCVVRLENGYASVELVGELNEHVRFPVGELAASIEDAIEAAAELTDRWIVRVDRGQESVVAGRALTRVLTVLTGVDEAARLACVRVLASLAGKLPRRADQLPLVRIAMMGAHDEAARLAGAEIADAASASLGQTVQHVTCTGQIRAARVPISMFNGPTSLQLSDVLDQIERALVSDTVLPWPPKVAALAVPQMLANTRPTQVSQPLAETGANRRGDGAELVESKAGLTVAQTNVAVEAAVEGKIEGKIQGRVAESRTVPPATEPDPVLGLALASGVDTDEGPIPLAPQLKPLPIEPMPVSDIADLASEEFHLVPAPTQDPQPVIRSAALMPWIASPAAPVDEVADAQMSTVDLTHTEPEPISSEPEALAVPDATSSQAVEPKPIHAQELARPDHGVRELAAFVQGLAKIDLTCPYAGDVEFGLDASGVVHVLARADCAGDDAALANLMVASSWATSHASLLASTLGRRAAERGAIMHLFTNRPKRSRRLLETNVQVHLLAPVQVGTQTVWYCTELN